jgi:hypothetical protein
MPKRKRQRYISAGELLRWGWTRKMIAGLGPPDRTERARRPGWSPKRLWLASKIVAGGVQGREIVAEVASTRRLVAEVIRKSRSFDPMEAALARDELRRLRG